MRKTKIIAFKNENITHNEQRNYFSRVVETEGKLPFINMIIIIEFRFLIFRDYVADST